jgi:hypothetical protein
MSAGPHAQAVLATTAHIPTDIQPVYPDRRSDQASPSKAGQSQEAMD